MSARSAGLYETAETRDTRPSAIASSRFSLVADCARAAPEPAKVTGTRLRAAQVRARRTSWENRTGMIQRGDETAGAAISQGEAHAPVWGNAVTLRKSTLQKGNTRETARRNDGHSARWGRGY